MLLNCRKSIVGMMYMRLGKRIRQVWGGWGGGEWGDQDQGSGVSRWERQVDEQQTVGWGWVVST